MSSGVLPAMTEPQDSTDESNVLGGHTEDCSKEPNEWTKPYRLTQYTLVWVCDECGHAMMEENTDHE
jgi:rubrerythrin